MPVGRWRRERRRAEEERGAVAVELVVILPILVVIVFGTIEFGRVLNTQIALTGAAREGARVMAIHNDPSQAQTAVLQAASMSPAPTVTVTPTSCTRGDNVTVRAQRQVPINVPFFGNPTFALEGVGVMRCGG
jgi:Flp pilus assembly protein TadG